MGKGFLKKLMLYGNNKDRILWFNSKEYWLKESVIKKNIYIKLI